MTKRVAIFASGGGSNAVKLMESMQGDHPAMPALIVTNQPNAGVIQQAERFGVACEMIDHKPYAGDRTAFETEIQNRLIPYQIDMICLAGFMRVLTAGFTDHWSGRMLNIHPSLLPKYKGLNTHARAIEAGDKRAGCTVHEVTAELDDGPILGQISVPILSGDTPAQLAARVLVQEHQLYPAVLKRFAMGNKTPIMCET
ncbi:MAG: phosphoribosylglycinamide formyltransferase [Rhodobacteraceae bacterium]|nr:phosphoribosylglycinamide formyltransferase [Paracoccaceae bacterium]NCV11983.1 phosphoribosylglycinamide formyltransferase [Paracoccaceae bacterium]NCV30977.1 phosphoribosylglycinamide formyltransferase [Paracoccaceae bacterium]NCV67793.1 phosphoribosylglycinamide formyltransferase [Paracoccaceae bacterium]NCW04615.1 phosphoribosylglycinamide formyltransferase [Paracoccaceae bacterium]